MTNDSSTNMKLAVYGSLKKGYSNHKVIRDTGTYLGSCWVEDYALADEGHFPSAFKFPGKKIWVEVYEVSPTTLAATDRLEGYHPERSTDNFYTREQVDTLFGPAFMYARLRSNLTAHSVYWFPDGVWDSWRTYRTAWLGWQPETNLVKLEKEKKDRRHVPSPVSQTGSGAMAKVWNPKTAEYEYVPWSQVGKPDEEPEPKKPKEPTSREMAQAMIKEGLEKAKLPEEKVG